MFAIGHSARRSSLRDTYSLIAKVTRQNPLATPLEGATANRSRTLTVGKLASTPNGKARPSLTGLSPSRIRPNRVRGEGLGRAANLYQRDRVCSRGFTWQKPPTPTTVA